MSMYQNEIIYFLEAEQQGSSSQYLGLCPAHGDSRPSLSIKFREESQNPLIYCHAGCDPNEIIEILREEGLWMNSCESDFYF